MKNNRSKNKQNLITALTVFFILLLLSVAIIVFVADVRKANDRALPVSCVDDRSSSTVSTSGVYTSVDRYNFSNGVYQYGSSMWGLGFNRTFTTLTIPQSLNSPVVLLSSFVSSCSFSFDFSLQYPTSSAVSSTPYKYSSNLRLTSLSSPYSAVYSFPFYFLHSIVSNPTAAMAAFSRISTFSSLQLTYTSDNTNIYYAGTKSTSSSNAHGLLDTSQGTYTTFFDFDTMYSIRFDSYNSASPSNSSILNLEFLFCIDKGFALSSYDHCSFIPNADSIMTDYFVYPYSIIYNSSSHSSSSELRYYYSAFSFVDSQKRSAYLLFPTRVVYPDFAFADGTIFDFSVSVPPAYSFLLPSPLNEDRYTAGYNAGIGHGFNEGHSAGYNEGYSGGYKIGYDNGNSAGFSAGVASANDYSFLGLIGSVIDAPIQAFMGLLSFDVLGVNLSTFVLTLFTFCIILKIVSYVL